MTVESFFARYDKLLDWSLSDQKRHLSICTSGDDVQQKCTLGFNDFKIYLSFILLIKKQVDIGPKVVQAEYCVNTRQTIVNKRQEHQ